jgi:hypothetical protein
MENVENVSTLLMSVPMPPQETMPPSFFEANEVLRATFESLLATSSITLANSVHPFTGATTLPIGFLPLATNPLNGVSFVFDGSSVTITITSNNLIGKKFIFAIDDETSVQYFEVHVETMDQIVLPIATTGNFYVWPQIIDIGINNWGSSYPDFFPAWPFLSTGTNINSITGLPVPDDLYVNSGTAFISYPLGLSTSAFEPWRSGVDPFIPNAFTDTVQVYKKDYQSATNQYVLTDIKASDFFRFIDPTMGQADFSPGDYMVVFNFQNTTTQNALYVPTPPNTELQNPGGLLYTTQTIEFSVIPTPYSPNMTFDGIEIRGPYLHSVTTQLIDPLEQYNTHMVGGNEYTVWKDSSNNIYYKDLTGNYFTSSIQNSVSSLGSNIGVPSFANTLLLQPQAYWYNNQSYEAWMVQDTGEIYLFDGTDYYDTPSNVIASADGGKEIVTPASPSLPLTQIERTYETKEIWINGVQVTDPNDIQKFYDGTYKFTYGTWKVDIVYDNSLSISGIQPTHTDTYDFVVTANTPTLDIWGKEVAKDSFGNYIGPETKADDLTVTGRTDWVKYAGDIQVNVHDIDGDVTALTIEAQVWDGTQYTTLSDYLALKQTALGVEVISSKDPNTLEGSYLAPDFMHLDYFLTERGYYSISMQYDDYKNVDSNGDPISTSAPTQYVKIINFIAPKILIEPTDDGTGVKLGRLAVHKTGVDVAGRGKYYGSVSVSLEDLDENAREFTIYEVDASGNRGPIAAKFTSSDGITWTPLLDTTDYVYVSGKSNIYEVNVVYMNALATDTTQKSEYFEVVPITTGLSIVGFGANSPTTVAQDTLGIYSDYVDVQAWDPYADITSFSYTYVDTLTGGALDKTETINASELGIPPYSGISTFDLFQMRFTKVGDYTVTINYTDEKGNPLYKTIDFKIDSVLSPTLQVYNDSTVKLDNAPAPDDYQRFWEDATATLGIDYPAYTTYDVAFNKTTPPTSDPQKLFIGNLTVLKDGVAYTTKLGLDWYNAFLTGDPTTNPGELPFTEPGVYTISLDFYNTKVGFDSRTITFEVVDAIEAIEVSVDGPYPKDPVPPSTTGISPTARGITNWQPLLDAANWTLGDPNNTLATDFTQYYNEATFSALDLTMNFDQNFYASVQVQRYDETSPGVFTVDPSKFDLTSTITGTQELYQETYTQPGLYIARIITMDPVGGLQVQYKAFEIVQQRLPGLDVNTAAALGGRYLGLYGGVSSVYDPVTNYRKFRGNARVTIEHPEVVNSLVFEYFSSDTAYLASLTGGLSGVKLIPTLDTNNPNFPDGYNFTVDNMTNVQEWIDSNSDGIIDPLELKPWTVAEGIYKVSAYYPDPDTPSTNTVEILAFALYVNSTGYLPDTGGAGISILHMTSAVLAIATGLYLLKKHKESNQMKKKKEEVQIDEF